MGFGATRILDRKVTPAGLVAAGSVLVLALGIWLRYQRDYQAPKLIVIVALISLPLLALAWTKKSVASRGSVVGLCVISLGFSIWTSLQWFPNEQWHRTRVAFGKTIDRLTEPDALIIFLTPGVDRPGWFEHRTSWGQIMHHDPVDFYLSRRKGWSVRVNQMTPELAETLREKGARYVAYFVGSLSYAFQRHINIKEIVGNVSLLTFHPSVLFAAWSHPKKDMPAKKAYPRAHSRIATMYTSVSKRRQALSGNTTEISAYDIAWLVLAAGLTAGVGEAAVRYALLPYQEFLSNRVEIHPQAVWMGAVTGSLFILFPTFVSFVVGSRLRWRLRGYPVAVLTASFIAFYSVILITRRVSAFALAILSLGAASQVARFAHARPALCRAIVKRVASVLFLVCMRLACSSMAVSGGGSVRPSLLSHRHQATRRTFSCLCSIRYADRRWECWVTDAKPRQTSTNGLGAAWCSKRPSPLPPGPCPRTPRCLPASGRTRPGPIGSSR